MKEASDIRRMRESRSTLRLRCSSNDEKSGFFPFFVAGFFLLEGKGKKKKKAALAVSQKQWRR